MRKVNVFNVINYLFITLISLICTLPLVLMFMVSITDERMIQKNGYSLIPKMFSIEAYKNIFTAGSQILHSYVLTIFVTLTGTLIAVIITVMAAYTLANKNVRYRNGLALYFYFTMLFSGGLVPWYLINRSLHIYENIFALIIPGLLFSPFNLFLVRNYMKGIPDSLRESATLDGAGDATIAFKIYLPLCKPVMAVIALFYGMGYWNDWWNAIMLVSNESLYPLQYLLYQLQSNVKMMSDLQRHGISAGIILPQESLKMATVMVTIGPILLLYPFLQKYFIKGLVIGSVKG